MFALGVRFLCDWSMGKRPDSHERPEWPPHPDRLFMALAAAHFETGGDPAQRRALEWLETLGPPALSASSHSERTTVTSYVPVNDRADPIKQNKPLAAMRALSIGRDRQARQFPVAIPDDPVVHFIWPDAAPGAEHEGAMRELCRYVTYIGHSASLVQAWVTDSPPPATRVPGEHLAGRPLRIAYRGRLRDLESDWRARVRPSRSAWADYVTPSPVAANPAPPKTVFDDQLVILRRNSEISLGLESTLLATKAFRGAVLSACPAPAPEWLSGHQSNGEASQRPHLALVPLAHVGRKHADGRLLGLALVLPRGIRIDEQRRCLGPLLFQEHNLPRELRLTLGKAGVWRGEIETRGYRASALCSTTWTRPAREWATVTPIVFDKHPRSREATTGLEQVEEMLMAACVRIGLPRPAGIALSPVSIFAGAPHTRQFPSLQHKKGGDRRHTHAVLKFEQEVRGPVLLGAGRYRGYGLCRPLHDGDESCAL